MSLNFFTQKERYGNKTKLIPKVTKLLTKSLNRVKLV